MRILKPETAENRRKKILNWVVYNYVNTGKPVSSELIASSSGLDISSATIRSVLKNLEETDYLEQPHTSGGRIPTDKGYREYVDNVLQLQRMALSEKERLEHEYENRIEQLDVLMRHTSKVIANLSKCAGFTLSAEMENDVIKRIDFVPMSFKSVLIIVVTHSGIVKHFPVILTEQVNKRYLRALASHINKKLKDIPLSDAARVIWDKFINVSEGNIINGEVLKKLYEYFLNAAKEEESVYLEGLSKISQYAEKDDFEDFRNIMRIIEERDSFSHMIKERLKECVEKKQISNQGGNRIVDVTIGSETHIKEFNNFSLITSSYCVKDKVVGLVGILGNKRMEYPKMISLVDSVSYMVEGMLSQWDELTFDD
ncbi:MAG: heat-inducible transcription repressor HrcA [Elusimicrobiales bacterium]|nr:heat-inducible transcription repressor HrcA [Elusimicrobiales bacterium]MCK5106902.1 heat-inducible transcription repressor HrcA [Elusimicrobiales bacterium]